MSRGRRFYHWFLVLIFAGLTREAFQRGGIGSGVAFMLMIVLAFPSGYIMAFWDRLTGGRRWLKYVLSLIIILIGCLFYPMPASKNQEKTVTQSVSTAMETPEEKEDSFEIYISEESTGPER